MKNPDVTEKLNAPATSTPASGSLASCEHILFVNPNGSTMKCPRDAVHTFDVVGGMCDLHWPLALIAGFKIKAKPENSVLDQTKTDSTNTSHVD